MNNVPQYLAYVFYLPSSEQSKKSYKPQIITEERTITDKAHQELYKGKEEIKARKEKEKEDRKRARQKKQETKLLEGENKKLKQLAKKKDKGSIKNSRGKQNEGKQSPQKCPQRASGLKFQQNLKELVCDESSADEYDNYTSTDSEDFNDKCRGCKSEDPFLHESKTCSNKVVDKWIQCNMCTEWFHLICLRENVDPEDDFVCEYC